MCVIPSLFAIYIYTLIAIYIDDFILFIYLFS